jgi:hypothetical protein
MLFCGFVRRWWLCGRDEVVLFSTQALLSARLTLASLENAAEEISIPPLQRNEICNERTYY